MVMANTSGRMERFTRDSSKTTKSTVKARGGAVSTGLIRTLMTVNISTIKKKEGARLSGAVATFTRASSSVTECGAMARCTGLMVATS